MAKQFIRHLEFYGFPDQNAFRSDVDMPSTEGKADKKDLDALSGKTEQFMSAQTAFNNAQELFNEDVEKSISGITTDIVELSSEIDEERERAISAETALDEKIDTEIADVRNDVKEYIRTKVKKYVDDADSELQSQIDVINGNLVVIDEQISGISNDLSENYYTKEEIDEKIPSGASEYVTSEELNEVYDELQDKIDVVSGTISSAIDDEISRAISAETSIDEKINNEVSERISAIEIINNEISLINSELTDVNELINNEIERAISAETALDEKIDEEIARAISAETALDEKIDTEIADVRSDVKTYINTKVKKYIDDEDAVLQNQINELNDEKADKTDVNAISGTVDAVSSDLANEITRATEVEQEISATVENIVGVVESAVTKVESYETRVSDLETGLADEIANREQGDLDIIGTTSDTKDDNTIYGAKKYAEEMKRQAVSESEVYTNDAVSGFETMVTNLSAETQQWLSSAATTGYVETRISNVKQWAKNEINNKVNDEAIERLSGDTALQIQISRVESEISGITSGISHNATRINTLTSWDGEDPEQYDDSGNGIIDVMHRELHSLEQGGIEKFWVNGENLEIVASNPTSGEVTFDVPISEIIDKDDYYKKEEVDEKIDEAVSGKADSDTVYTKEEVDEIIAEKDEEINLLNLRCNKLIQLVIDSKTYNLPDDGDFKTLMKNDGIVKLTEDIETSVYTPGVTANNFVTLNLGGKTLTVSGVTGATAAVYGRNKQEITVNGSGKIDAINGKAVMANGEDVLITLGGTMFGRPTYVTDANGAELIYAYLGTIIINEGIFRNNGADKTFTLNCYDANYRAGKANIVVYGGKFYDFDPGNNTAEGPGTSFLAPGYHTEASTVVEEGVEHTIYTVKKD